MTKKDATYQNSKVQIPQGADRLSIDSDGYFDFYGEYESTGEELRPILYHPAQLQVIANSAGAGSGVLSTINLPTSMGIIVLSIGDAASNASAWLCSGVKIGQRLIIMTRGVGSTGSVMISTSGVTINDGRVSRIGIRNSADSIGMVELVGIGDEQWAVVATVGAGVTLHDGA